MKKNFLLIGSNGNLGTKIASDLDIDKKIDLHNRDEILKYCEKNKNIVVIIATPPKTHNYYIKLLSKEKNVEQILCEKPLPLIEDKKKIQFERVRIIDHYLYKKSISSLIKYFKENRNSIFKIEFYLCENKKEFREWMFDNDKFGGVTYDLAHHLIAILGLLIGYEKLNYIRNINIDEFKTFGENLSDKEVKCSFEILDLEILLHVGKSIEQNKKVVFFLDNGESKEFKLNEHINYKYILSEPSKLLDIEKAISINNILEKILNTQKILTKVSQYKQESAEVAVNLLEKLNEEFKHRHSFYWSVYYKLLFYHLIFVATPAFLYYNVRGAGFIGVETIPYISFILSIIVFLLIIFYFLKKTEIYLEEEEHRMKNVVDNMRHLYYANFRINMYPNENQALSYKEILYKQSIRQKSMEKGLGANFMMTIFKFIAIVASLLSIGFFSYIIYVKSHHVVPVYQEQKLEKHQAKS